MENFVFVSEMQSTKLKATMVIVQGYETEDFHTS